MSNNLANIIQNCRQRFKSQTLARGIFQPSAKGVVLTASSTARTVPPNQEDRSDHHGPFSTFGSEIWVVPAAALAREAVRSPAGA